MNILNLSHEFEQRWSYLNQPDDEKPTLYETHLKTC